MSIPSKYGNVTLPVKFMLNSYRALNDGRRGIQLLKDSIEKSGLLSDWKVTWCGTCTILRISVDLFRKVAQICLDNKLADGFKKIWSEISTDRKGNAIYWEFLRVSPVWGGASIASVQLIFTEVGPG